MHDAGNAAIAGNEQMCEGAGRVVKPRHIRSGDARQSSMRDDLAAECGKAEGGAIATAAVERLLDVSVGREAKE